MRCSKKISQSNKQKDSIYGFGDRPRFVWISCFGPSHFSEYIFLLYKNNPPLLVSKNYCKKYKGYVVKEISQLLRPPLIQWPSQYLKLGIQAVSWVLLFLFLSGVILNQAEVSKWKETVFMSNGRVRYILRPPDNWNYNAPWRTDCLKLGQRCLPHKGKETNTSFQLPPWAVISTMLQIIREEGGHRYSP